MGRLKRVCAELEKAIKPGRATALSETQFVHPQPDDSSGAVLSTPRNLSRWSAVAFVDAYLETLLEKGEGP